MRYAICRLNRSGECEAALKRLERWQGTSNRFGCELAGSIGACRWLCIVVACRISRSWFDWNTLIHRDVVYETVANAVAKARWTNRSSQESFVFAAAEWERWLARHVVAKPVFAVVPAHRNRRLWVGTRLAFGFGRRAENRLFLLKRNLGS